MITQTVEYALRAMIHLSHHAPDAQTTEQIAVATKVPSAYLSKVLQGLRRAELLHLRRGIGGGVSLVKPPDEITILDVVNAVDPLQRIVSCPLKLASHGEKLCPLHRRMDDAMASVEQAFANSTLADVLADPSTSVPLCNPPKRKSGR